MGYGSDRDGEDRGQDTSSVVRQPCQEQLVMHWGLSSRRLTVPWVDAPTLVSS